MGPTTLQGSRRKKEFEKLFEKAHLCTLCVAIKECMRLGNLQRKKFIWFMVSMVGKVKIGHLVKPQETSWKAKGTGLCRAHMRKKGREGRSVGLF